MKGRLIALGHVNEIEVAALMVDGRLDDLIFETDAPTPGTIYRATAGRPIKGQGGMFMNTPDGMGFLRQVKGVAPGDTLLVQVTGYAEPSKAVPVTQKLLFKSRYAIITPSAPGINISRAIKDDDIRDSLLEIAHAEMEGSAMGLILRSSCAEADADEIAQDINQMLDLATAIIDDSMAQEIEKLIDGDTPHTIAWREWTSPATVVSDPGALADHGILDQIDALRQAKAPLSGGAFMFIEPTRALTAVDVNTGADTSPAAGMKANLAAAKELPRQLRLRGIGGQITLDLAPMNKKDRRQFENTLRAAFRLDPVESALVGWTPLGHFEVQRKRDRVGLNEVPI
ncbi:ribonuclease E/G [uncultured Roseovarius sp.]|uniref:ribonuclease E/G n=1 Tax=uncultured Roseovarius sp. TaxID=293344 RepID=UPI00260E9A84|nr:ribonuclease E/G [uncultured Roseovarius sp.]